MKTTENSVYVALAFSMRPHNDAYPLSLRASLRARIALPTYRLPELSSFPTSDINVDPILSSISNIEVKIQYTYTSKEFGVKPTATIKFIP